MASIFVITVLFGGLALAGAGFLFHHIRRYLQWSRDTHMEPWKQLLLILPPLALSLAAFGRGLLAAPARYPVQRGVLEEITAQVEMVREYKSHQATGRSVRTVKRYQIYLEGYDNFLCIPDNFNFDQDGFLRWAESREVTFLYARTGGQLTVYQIQQGDKVFLDYAQASERLTVTFLSSLLIDLTALLFGLGGSVYLPEFLSPRDKAKREQRILGLVYAALVLAACALLSYLISQPQITEILAGVSALAETGWRFL